MPIEFIEGLNWRGSTLPLPSAFSLLSVPARLGGWGRAQLSTLLQRPLTAGSAAYLGWAALTQAGTIKRASEALNQRPESLRLGAELQRWWPPPLRPLLHEKDPTTFDRLRFCRQCLLRGDHSPLFQLPWWIGCPIHDEPLYEGCPQCQAPIPAGLPHENPAGWLVCPHCYAELSNRAQLAHLHQLPSRHSNATWWRVLAAYRRWLHATQSIHWALPWSIQGDGSFSDVAHLAVRHLVTMVPTPIELAKHLPPMTMTSGYARAWSRTFVEHPTPPRVQELGFASPQAMIKAGRQYYGALPITDSCCRALVIAERRLRRQLHVPLIGYGSSRAVSDAVLYDWRGERTPAVLAFRLLTGLVATDRVNGVAYLDFRAVQLLLEPPVRMAQKMLELWTGLDLHELRAWPQNMAKLLIEPSWVLRVRGMSPDLKRDHQPRGAVGWLYDRLILEAWQDIALECFSRAKPGGILAWTVGERLAADNATYIDVPLEAKFETEGELFHPLLVHARADRQRPRGWATAIMQVASEGAETYIALLGRAAGQPFALPSPSPFHARWTWPSEIAPEEAASTLQKTT